MIPFVSYLMLFAAWIITFFSLGKSLKRITMLRNENLKLMNMIKDLHQELAKLKKEGA